MKVTYAKCVLFAYPHLKELSIQIDDLVERKAVGSMSDFTPCLFQCEAILNLTEQKKSLLKLNLILDKIVSSLTDIERIYLEYRYFKRKKREFYDGYDFSSRNYFRRQNRLIQKVASKLAKVNFTDKLFEDEYLTMDFFKEMLKRVNEYEVMSRRNKTVQEKLAIKGYSTCKMDNVTLQDVKPVDIILPSSKGTTEIA